MHFNARRTFSHCVDKHVNSRVCQNCDYSKPFHVANLHISKWISLNEHICKFGAT